MVSLSFQLNFQADISTLSKLHNRQKKNPLLIRTIHFFRQFHSVSLGQEVAAVTRPHMVKVDAYPRTASVWARSTWRPPPLGLWPVTCENIDLPVSLQFSLWTGSDLCSHSPLSHKQWRHKHLLVLRYVHRDTNRHTHTNTHLQSFLFAQRQSHGRY